MVSVVKGSEVLIEKQDMYKGCNSVQESHFEGICSSSWAITVASVASDYYCSVNKSETARQNRRFSYQHLMECCNTCIEGFQNGCMGGDFRSAMDYLISKGVVSGSKFESSSKCKNYNFKECNLMPGENTDSACKDSYFDYSKAVGVCNKKCPSTSSIKYEDDLIKLNQTMVTRVEAAQGEKMVNAISKLIDTGNIVIGEMDVFEDLYSYKKETVYTHIDGRPMGKLTVAIIGYLKDKYWVVRLPWGEQFGDKGKIKLVYGTNACGLEESNRLYYFKRMK